MQSIVAYRENEIEANLTHAPHFFIHSYPVVRLLPSCYYRFPQCFSLVARYSLFLLTLFLPPIAGALMKLQYESIYYVNFFPFHAILCALRPA